MTTAPDMLGSMMVVGDILLETEISSINRILADGRISLICIIVSTEGFCNFPVDFNDNYSQYIYLQ